MSRKGSIRLRLLGGASIRVGNRALSGPAAQRHRLALLALLASSHPEGRLREKLVGYLWPAKDAGRGRNLLNQATHHLRRALGADAIVSSGDELLLDAGAVRCDVVEFEGALDAGRPERAVKLYGGPLLDGFHLSGAVEFERWVDAERRRLADRYRRAVEKLAGTAEAERRWTDAVAWWKRRAAEDPLNSRVAVRLMKALAGEGNLAGALEVARRHEHRLRDELGAPPPDEIRALVERLTGSEEESRPPATAAAGSGTRPGGGEGAEREKHRSEPGDAVPAHAGAGRANPDDPAAGGGPAREERDRRPGRREPASHRDAPESTALRWALAGIGVLVVGVVLWVLRDASGADPRPPPSGGEAPSVAVLPFANLGSPEDGHFAHGITEELVVRLAGAPELDVIAPTSALQYGSEDTDVRTVGEELGVDYALEGTVRWETGSGSESRVRVTAQLVRTSDGTHLWGESYDRELDEVFAVQDAIASRVTRELNLVLPERRRARSGGPPTEDLDAYDHYLQGNAYLARQFSGGAVRSAIGQYERAVELDPGFAGAWRRLVHARLWLTWVLGDEEQGLRAREDLRRLEASSEEDHPEVRLARGWHLYYGERRYEEALREFEAVRRIRPGDAGVLRVVGLLHQRLGRTEAALATMKEALELSPRDAELAFAVARTLHWTGRYDEALSYYERAFSLAPDEDLGFLYSSLEQLHLARGDTARARRARDRARELDAGAWQGGRAELYGRDFRRAARRIRSMPATRFSRLFRHDNLAVAYGRLGEEGLRKLHADSLLELASRMAPASWERPRAQPASTAWIFSGLARIHLGEPDAGLRDVQRALEIEKGFEDALIGPYTKALAARAHVRAGRDDEALDLLEAARETRGTLSRHDLRHDPEWDPLRDHPRFRRLVNGENGKGRRGGR